MEKENSLETLLQVKDDKIRILREIIDNREGMIAASKELIISHEKHIKKLNKIIKELKKFITTNIVK
jgi:uncharacterized protein (DUF3084 family)